MRKLGRRDVAAIGDQYALVNERSLAAEQNLPPLINYRQVIEMATIAGAKAAHLDRKIGSLTPGKEADIIMLATDRINVFPLNNVPGTIVTLMDTCNVENVFVAEKVMKWHGKLIGIDLNRVRPMIEKSRDAVLARAGYSADPFGTCCPVARLERSAGALKDDIIFFR